MYTKKRPVCTKRDLYVRQKTWKTGAFSRNICHKYAKVTCIYKKRPIFTKRNLYSYDKRPSEQGPSAEIPATNMSKETHIYQKRPILRKRDEYNWKETYTYTIGDRQIAPPLRYLPQICQERPVYTKRDLYLRKETYIYEKRPMETPATNMSRETCIYEKRPVPTR